MSKVAEGNVRLKDPLVATTTVLGAKMNKGRARLYVDVFGTVPETCTPETREAWDREQARGWVTSTPMHATFRPIDGPMVESFFRSQMAMSPEMRVPMLADRAHSITVVRHGGGVG